jgi:hypothetical protein
MGFFRRKHEETLNEQLLREAGLGGDAAPARDDEPAATLDPLAGRYPADSPLGAYTAATARPALGDVVATAHASGIGGRAVTFVALPTGDLIVEQESGDADLSPFADVVEHSLRPPYRAEANRLEGDRWAIVASAIRVEEFSYDGADALDLVSRGGTTSLSADGDPVSGTVGGLEAAGAALAPEYAVHAERLDGDLWEVRAAAL